MDAAIRGGELQEDSCKKGVGVEEVEGGSWMRGLEVGGEKLQEDSCKKRV